MIHRKKSPLLKRISFVTIAGLTFAFLALTPSKVFSSSSVDMSGISISIELLTKESIFLAQHGGPPEGMGHGGRGRHCSEMDRSENCRGRQGMRHRGGMGMHHEGGTSGTAKCPQPRTTLQAPDDFHNISNPLDKTADNIEKGRLLFHVDVQPSCVMCHGSQGDGTGEFGAGMNPRPRNFTCTETMKNIPDGQVFWIIQNGSPNTGMPPFQSLRDEQIWQLILYLRSLGK